MALPDRVIRKLWEEGLIIGAKDAQIQPAGIDLTLRRVMIPRGKGELGFSREERRLPGYEEIEDEDGWFTLGTGGYVIEYGEVVHIPEWALGLVFPRSSLLRMGAVLYTAVWDPGYRGRGKGLLNVLNPEGVRLKRGARIGQLILIRTTEKPESVYRGFYQSEGL